MVNMRMLACMGMLASAAIFCSTVSAGPIDNANEFVESAVENAEANDNPPSDQSPDTPAISWAGADSDAGAAVNTDTAGSTGTQ